ncbi:hypothetical protein [Synechococcus sp. TAK9802]|uniref:hypothetical protein n=1 Tax=Synechococcus sp. TAK9802 TaxID=1442558 RepID=UPI00164631F6|nr:hypothetical protein [Synechococcus sp. TAK9802]QNI62660.1 hypothetical protein SynTAK9802_02386 [Synechococcus sp. TAK9802]
MGALAGPAFAAEPDDQSEGTVQPAFSAISGPCVRQLEIMETSSKRIVNAGNAFGMTNTSRRKQSPFHAAAS